MPDELEQLRQLEELEVKANLLPMPEFTLTDSDDTEESEYDYTE
jgi:hypothetical protein